MNVKTKNPFEGLQIDSHNPLHKVSRTKCPKCSVSRKYFCYKCYIPMPDIAGTFQTVELPLKVDIIKHPLEVDGKSTAVHARLLAPDHVTIYTYPDMPQYENKEKVLLVFPYKDAVCLEDLVQQRTASDSKAKLENCQVDQHVTPAQEGNLKMDNPHGTDMQNSLMTKNGTERNSSCSETDPNSTTYTETCGYSHLLKDGHNSQSEPDSIISEPISQQNCNHLASGQTSPKLLISSKETGPQSETSELKAKGSSHHLANEQLSVKVKQGSQERDVTLSNHQAESHRCHQYSHRSSPDEHTHSDVAESVVSVEADGQEHRTKKAKGDSVEGPYDRVIFIDSTWNQCGVISRDKRLTGIKRVILQDRLTTFWRSQYCKPETYLATIEAIYYFLIDYHTIVLGKAHNGQYDNLLYFYSFLHTLVQKTAEEREILRQDGKT